MPKKINALATGSGHPHEPGQRLASEMERLSDYRYRGADILRFLLDAVFVRFGLTPRDTIPDDIHREVQQLTALYLDGVRDTPPFTDILGPAYMLVASHGQRDILAQFFTPISIASMMARMTIGEPPAAGQVLRSCDPACGSGVMMLCFAQAMHEIHGTSALKQLSITCVDIDQYCARMAAAQFLCNLYTHDLALAELLVLRGDSLLPDPSSTEVMVHATCADLPEAEYAPALHPARLEAVQSAAVAQGVGTQLQFFCEET